MNTALRGNDGLWLVFDTAALREVSGVLRLTGPPSRLRKELPGEAVEGSFEAIPAKLRRQATDRPAVANQTESNWIKLESRLVKTGQGYSRLTRA